MDEWTEALRRVRNGSATIAEEPPDPEPEASVDVTVRRHLATADARAWATLLERAEGQARAIRGAERRHVAIAVRHLAGAQGCEGTRDAAVALAAAALAFARSIPEVATARPPRL